MPYKIGFTLDNGKMLWLTKTYASKSYAEKVMKRERKNLLDAGVKINVPHIVNTEEGNLKLATRSTNPSGTSRIPSGKASSETHIKPWYRKTYPTDGEGQNIDPKATFKGAMDVLLRTKTTSDIYDYINVHDSLVRERIFDELARRTGKSYDTIYRMWLGEIPKQTTAKPSQSKTDSGTSWGVYGTLKKSDTSTYPKEGWWCKYGSFVPEKAYAVRHRTREEALETINILSKTNPEYRYEVKKI